MLENFLANNLRKPHFRKYYFLVRQNAISLFIVYTFMESFRNGSLNRNIVDRKHPLPPLYFRATIASCAHSSRRIPLILPQTTHRILNHNLRNSRAARGTPLRPQRKLGKGGYCCPCKPLITKYVTSPARQSSRFAATCIYVLFRNPFQHKPTYVVASG